MTNLDELQALLDAGTGLPWCSDQHPNTAFKPDQFTVRDSNGMWVAELGPARNDADLIAAAVNALPALLAVARAAEAHVKTSAECGTDNNASRYARIALCNSLEALVGDS